MSETRDRILTPQSVAALLNGFIDPRPAEYRGVRMRSQLEADFAKHLDNMGLRDWQYEPLVFRGEVDAGYLPDFVLALDGRNTYFEVKPRLADVRKASRRMEVIWESEPTAVLVVVSAQGCTFFSAALGHSWESWTELWSHG